jgi:iron complex transport system substrate-binding protein
MKDDGTLNQINAQWFGPDFALTDDDIGCGAYCPPAPVTLTDSFGHEVHLAAPPTRIVSLAASNTEIVFAIGAGDRLVGRDEFSDFPTEALEVGSIGSLYPKVNAEVVVALNPDLVLAAGITNPDDVTALTELGLAVYATSFAATLDDIYNDILAVGTLTGETTSAQAVVDNMQARVRAVEKLTANVSDRPTVFYEIDATDPSKPWTSGPGSFIDLLISTAGGTNVGAASSEAYWQISLEELVQQDPQIIVLGSSKYGGQTPEIVAERAGWGQIDAVTAGNVHTFDDDLVSRPGPRLVHGLEALTSIIHPELSE